MLKVVIMLGVILWAVLYFVLLQGKHDGLYFIKLNNFNKVVPAILFCILFRQIKLQPYCNLVKIVATWFCITYALLEMYPWWPDTIRSIEIHDLTISKFMSWCYFLFWGISCIPLTIYTYICYKNSLQ